MRARSVVVVVTWLISLGAGTLLALPAIAGLKSASIYRHYSYEELTRADPSAKITKEDYEQTRRLFQKYEPLITIACVTLPLCGIVPPWIVYWCGKGLLYLVRRKLHSRRVPQ